MFFEMKKMKKDLVDWKSLLIFVKQIRNVWYKLNKKVEKRFGRLKKFTYLCETKKYMARSSTGLVRETDLSV